MEPMLRVCAWCNRQLDDNNRPYGPPIDQQQQKAVAGGRKVTHGICPECFANMEKEMNPNGEVAGTPPPATSGGGFGNYVANRDGH